MKKPLRWGSFDHSKREEASKKIEFKSGGSGGFAALWDGNGYELFSTRIKLDLGSETFVQFVEEAKEKGRRVKLACGMNCLVLYAGN